ncbi:MAG: hypothetical protein AAF675_15865 [Pseudomonadota bacterium]
MSWALVIPLIVIAAGAVALLVMLLAERRTASRRPTADNAGTAPSTGPDAQAALSSRGPRS